MAFPERIDFDRITKFALEEIVSEVVNDWMEGRPRDEVAFMNRTTQKLARTRRGCDVGVEQRIKMSGQVAMLHRKGKNQIDKYGADLALTVCIDQEPKYVKTAVFQIKKSEFYDVTVVKRQLLDAKEDQRIEERSFALAVDEERGGIRIEEIDDLISDFDSQDEKKFDCSDWFFLTRWLWQWLSCDLGPASDPDNPDSVEKLLQEFVVDADDEWQSPWASGDVTEELPEGYLPARSWIVLFFEREEESNK